MQPFHFLFQFSPDSDPSCFFRTRFDSANASIADLDAVISVAHTNATHTLSLAVGRYPDSRPRGEDVPGGAFSCAHQFLLAPVRWSRLIGVMDYSVVSRVYKQMVRYTLYCPVVKDQRIRRDKERARQRALRERESTSGQQQQECGAVENKLDRLRCRQKKIERCRTKRRRRGKTRLQMPCTSKERRRAAAARRTLQEEEEARRKMQRKKKSKRRKKWPWETDDCDAVRSSIDRRLCRRRKRRRCRAELAAVLPGQPPAVLADMCRRQQWLGRCERRERRRRRRQRRQRRREKSRERSTPDVESACKSKLKRQVRRERKRSNGAGEAIMSPRHVKYL